MNTSIATLLERKGGTLRTVPHTLTVVEAVQEMNRHKIGSVVVMDGQSLVGIFTERDVLRRVVGGGLDPLLTPVTEVMTTNVATIEAVKTVQEAMDMFQERRCRHLPVTKDGELLGLISIGDVSRWVAGTYRAEAESLRQYIAGGLTV